MGVLYVKVGGAWIPISSGGDEVFVGPNDPIPDNPGAELWYDTDAVASFVATAYAWHSQASSVASASGVVTYLTQTTAALADGFHLGTATGVANNTAICDKAGRYLIDGWVSVSAAVAGNIWNQLEIRVMRAGNPLYSRIFVGSGCPNGQYSGIAGMIVADLQVGDAIQLAFTAGGAAVTIDTRSHLVITSIGGATGPQGPQSIGLIGRAVVTAPQSAIGTAPVDLTGFLVAFTALPNRLYKVTASLMLNSISGAAVVVQLTDGVNAALNQCNLTPNTVVSAQAACFTTVITPPAGTYTVKLRGSTGAGTTITQVSATIPGLLLVEDIGGV